MVNLKLVNGGSLKTAENFAQMFPEAPVTVIEGDDLVLQELTPSGEYFLIQMSSPGSTFILGYHPPPSARRETLPYLSPRPFATLEAAEAEAGKVREMQARSRSLQIALSP